MGSAHYRLETKIVGRQAKGKDKQPVPGKQVSVVAKAAYRSGQSLKDERAGKTFNFRSRTQEVVYSEIMAPDSAPDWLKAGVPDANAGTKKQREVREQLWNTINRVEKRKDSQLAREFVASLPRGLDREQQIELVRGWCKAEFTDKGFVVDLALHKSKGNRNPHAHILVTTRPATPDGFGKKPDTSGKFNGRGAAGMGAKDDLIRWRQSWESHVNVALEKAGREERVDCRSLKARGIDRLPEPKIGVAATAMKRRGRDADPQRFQLVRWIRTLNAARPFIQAITKGEGVPLVGPEATWWERSFAVARQAVKEVVDVVRDKWRMMLDAQRHKEDLDGPRL